MYIAHLSVFFYSNDNVYIQSTGYKWSLKWKWKVESAKTNIKWSISKWAYKKGTLGNEGNASPSPIKTFPPSTTVPKPLLSSHLLFPHPSTHINNRGISHQPCHFYQSVLAEKASKPSHRGLYVERWLQQHENLCLALTDLFLSSKKDQVRRFSLMYPIPFLPSRPRYESFQRTLVRASNSQNSQILVWASNSHNYQQIIHWRGPQCFPLQKFEQFSAFEPREFG